MDRDKTQTATQTPSGDLWEISAKVANSRSLLDLAAEYILSGQDWTAEERLNTVLFAVETARNEAKAAEDALYSFNPYRLGTARERAIETENTALKARLIELERDKADAWKEARAEARAYQPTQRTEENAETFGQNDVIEVFLTEYLNANHTGKPLNDRLSAISSEIDRQIKAGAVDADIMGDYELAATRVGFYEGYKAGFSVAVAAKS